MKTTAFCLDDRGAYVVRAAYTPFARVLAPVPPRDLGPDHDTALWWLGDGVMVELNHIGIGARCVLRMATPQAAPEVEPVPWFDRFVRWVQPRWRRAWVGVALRYQAIKERFA